MGKDDRLIVYFDNEYLRGGIFLMPVMIIAMISILAVFSEKDFSLFPWISFFDFIFLFLIRMTSYAGAALFMFGFDNDQKGKIERLLKEDGSLDGINYYFKGSTKNIDLKTLYECESN